jgi:hypothetical protein
MHMTPLLGGKEGRTKQKSRALSWAALCGTEDQIRIT